MNHLAKISAVLGVLVMLLSASINVESAREAAPAAGSESAPELARDAARPEPRTQQGAGGAGSVGDFDDFFEDEFDETSGEIVLTPEQIDELIEIAEQIDPRLARRLQQACDSDPADFQRLLRQAGRRVIALAQLKEQDPRLYSFKLKEWHTESEIQYLTRQLAAAIREEDISRQARLEAELEDKIRVHFVVTLASRGEYLRRLKEHVERLERELNEDGANFAETVARMLEDTRQQAESLARGERASRSRR